MLTKKKLYYTILVKDQQLQYTKQKDQNECGHILVSKKKKECGHILF